MIPHADEGDEPLSIDGEFSPMKGRMISRRSQVEELFRGDSGFDFLAFGLPDCDPFCYLVYIASEEEADTLTRALPGLPGWRQGDKFRGFASFIVEGDTEGIVSGLRRVFGNVAFETPAKPAD